MEHNDSSLSEAVVRIWEATADSMSIAPGAGPRLPAVIDRETGAILHGPASAEDCSNYVTSRCNEAVIGMIRQRASS